MSTIERTPESMEAEPVADGPLLSPPGDGPRMCPRKAGFVYFNRDTGQVAPARCDANTCGYCGPLRASLVGGAITQAEPQRFGTLTQVGDDFGLVRNRMKRLAYNLRQAGIANHWCWHVEPNPRGTGHHVHFFQRGEFVPQALLSELATREGMGRVTDIRRFRAPTTKGVTYGVKLAGITYGLKMAEADESMRTYLGVNGSRLVHASRGFWQVDRAPATQREAMKAWARRNGGGEGTWEFIRREHLPRALASAE